MPFDAPAGQTLSTAFDNPAVSSFGQSTSTGFLPVPLASPLVNAPATDVSTAFTPWAGEDSDPYSLDLFHGENQRYIGALPLGQGIRWRREISKPGSGDFSLPTDDPMLSAVTVKRIVRISKRGTVQQSVIIGPRSTQLTSDDGMYRTFSTQKGTLGWLDDCVIQREYDNGASTSNNTRVFGWPARKGSWMGSDWPHVGGGAMSLRWDLDNFHRKGRPYGSGFSKTKPYWISRSGVYTPRPAGAPNFYRFGKIFDRPHNVLVTYTCDDYPEFWLNGVLINSVTGNSTHGWETVYTWQGRIEAGPTVFALKAQSSPILGPPPDLNPVAGIMSVVDIDTNAVLLTTDPTWQVYRGADANGTPGMTAAYVAILTVTEAQAAGVTAANRIAGFSFTAATDTNGHPFTDSQEYTVTAEQTTIGSFLPELAQRGGVDFDIDPATNVMHCFVRQGSDKYASVEFKTGDLGGNILDAQPAYTPAKATRVYLQKQSGPTVQFTDAAGVAAWGVIEQGVSLGTDSNDTLAAEADKFFDENAQPVTAGTTRISDLDGPQVGRGLTVDMGDSVKHPDENAAAMRVRVLGITEDASNEEPSVSFDWVQDQST